MPPTDPTLSPRDLARTLGVSESSVKRWIDSGRLPARRTAGGHRRIELFPALRLLEKSGRLPARIDLPDLAPEDQRCLDDALAFEERVHALLQAGQGPRLERLLLAALATRRMDPAALYDGPLRTAMARIGEEWRSGCEGVFVEHRATQILLRALDRIDGTIDAPGDDLLAVGGSLAGDPSLLPTRMAASVLVHAGVYPVNLGGNTPTASLLEAADQLRARLVWVSVSYASEVARARSEVSELARALAARGVLLVVGGRALEALQLDPDLPLRVGSDLATLARLARGLRASGEPE